MADLHGRRFVERKLRHSPHVDHHGETPGPLRGLWHAHVGWLFDHPTALEAEKYAPDLLDDRGMRFISRWFAVWAALRALGREGVIDLVDRCCEHARSFAALLGAEPEVEILNDVVLNQVLVGFGDDAETDRVIAEVQREGTCWLGGTTWRGRRGSWPASTTTLRSRSPVLKN